MEYKATYTICGSKGTGKTTLAFKFTGKKLCFSYDHKAPRIKEYLFADSKEIEIIDGVAEYERTPERMVPTSRIQYDNIERQILECTGQYDWIIHDGIEKMHEMCEMAMRHEFKLKPFEGFKERAIWKYRRVLLSNLHRKSLESVKKGVIYCTYLGYEDMQIEDGEVVTRRMAPKYFDVIEEETDVVFLTSIRQDKETTKFIAKVVTSKVPKWLTGSELDVTMKVPQIIEEQEG